MARGKIAALFVETGGRYFGLADVDPWDEVRDARTYAGPHSVIAHPPCFLWVNLAAVNWKRYRREKPAWYPGGNDGGCFASALASVRKWGGGARTSRRVLGLEAFWLGATDQDRLAAMRAVGVRRARMRGLAKCIWTPCAKANMVVLQRHAAPRTRLVSHPRNGASWMVRPHQAYAFKEGSIAHARGVRRSVDRAGDERRAAIIARWT